MLTILCSILLVSVLQIQAYEYSSSFFTTYCSGNYYTDPSKVFFCHYFQNPDEPTKEVSTKFNECKPCREMINRIKWNDNTGKAVENWIAYSTNHFCDNVKITSTADCKKRLTELKPQLKVFLTQMMKDGRFCEAMLKCDKKDSFMFSSYYKTPFMDMVEYYPAQFFDYFFNLENYSKDFYPYYFFNYFYKCQDEGYCPYADFAMFYKHPEHEKGYYFYNYFDSYFKNKTTEKPFFPYSFFEYFFQNQESGFYPNQYSFFDYFSKYQQYDKQFYPYNFFGYFFKNHTTDAEHNPFYHFYMYEKNPEKKESFCSRCEKIPKSQFEKWRKSVDIKKMTETGYQTMCKDTSNVERCHLMVDQIVLYLIVRLEDALTKETICHHLFKCPRTVIDDRVYDFFHFYSTSPVEEYGEKNCQVCKSISEIFNYIIRENHFNEYVKGEFNRTYCEKLFPNKRDECNTYIRTKLDDGISKIKQTLQSHPLCRSTCQEKSREEFYFQFFDLFYNSENQNCSVCKAIASIIKSQIESEEFRTIITYQFQSVYCKEIFPTEEICETYMVKQFPKCITNMTQELDKNILCKNSCGKRIDTLSSHIHHHEKEDKPNCTLCKDVIKRIINTRPTSRDIDTYLDNVYIMYPAIVQPVVRNLIKEHRNEIRTNILAGKTNEDVCQLIHQCPTNPKFYHMFEKYFQFL